MNAIRRKRAAILLAVAVLCFLGSLPCRAQSAPEKEIPAPYKVPGRLKVGLVLSGGGARGVAHIGVLKVLEELRVPVDFIAGTSMGSLVGGFYASGVSPEEMEKRVAVIDWPSVLKDNPAREDIPWRQKRDDFTDLFGLELGLRDGKLLVPLGTVAGYKFEFLMTEFVGLEAGRADRNFDSLPIPYRAVAMDLESGDMKVFDRGYLVKAMRASMSIPAVFAPVEIGGRLYVDGGMVRNLPVDVARSAGCEIIIAVNLGTPPLRRDQITSSASVALQAVNLMTEQNVKASLGELTERDILINLIPGLGDFSSGDFTGAMKTIPIGIKAARESERKLRALGVSEKDYRDWQKVRAARVPGAVEIADVHVAQNLKWVNPEVIETEIKQKPTRIEARIEERLFTREAEQSQVEALQRELTTVFGRGDFERLDYHLKDDQKEEGRNRKIVEVEGVEKSWGPNYVRVGLGYYSDFGDEQRFSAYLMHRMTWLNSLGAEWRNDLAVGYDSYFHTEFYQPFTRRVGIFAAPWLDLKQNRIDYYIGEDWFGQYKVNTYRGGLDVGVQGRLGEVRLGFFQGWLKTDARFGILSVGSGVVPQYSLRQGGWMGKLVIDQLDSASFPRKGFLLSGTGFVTDSAYGAEDNYTKTELFFQKPFSIDQHTLTFTFDWGGSPENRIPVYDLFQVGGFLRFSGYEIEQLVGQSYYLGRAVYTYRFADLPQALGRAVYLGGSLEVGEVGNRFDPTTAGGTLYCGSVFFAADTILGPFYLSYGRAADSSDAFYVMLGLKTR
jgi:NTE family protein